MYHGAKYQHLKAGRVRTSEGMYLTGNAKYADAIIESLGLAKAKSVGTDADRHEAVARGL